jgi:hypothetical protein
MFVTLVSRILGKRLSFLLATRTCAGGKTQTDGLPYPDLFLTAVYDYAALYESFGLPDCLRAYSPNFVARQQSDGLFVDTALSNGQKISAVMAAIGEANLASLPKQTRDAIAHGLKRIESCTDDNIQLYGPEISIPLN